MKIDNYKRAAVGFFKKRAAKNSSETEDDNSGEMSFLEHLEELRDVIIKCLIALVIAFIISTVGFHYLNKGLMYPLNSAKTLLVNYFNVDSNPPEAKAEKIGPFYLVKYEDGKESAREGPFFMESQAKVLEEGSVSLTRLVQGDLNALSWHSKIQLRAMSFQTPIVLWFSVGLLGALGLALPFILYFIAKFIAPGLTEKERGIMKPTIAVAVFLFFIGAAFAFSFMLPMGIAFMAWMSQNMGLEMFPDAQSYYMMVIFLTLVVGITFEVPLLITVLIYLGVLNPDSLKKNRRMVFLVILIFATVVTPPDCITQISLAIPLYLLYELALIIGVRFRNKKLKREAEEERLAEIQDEKERKEYIESEAAKRRAEEADENDETSATPKKKYDDNLPDDYDPNKDDEYEDHHHYDYDDDDYDPYNLDDFVDSEEEERLNKIFGPNWQLNEPDLSYFTPKFKEPEKADAETEVESETEIKTEGKDETEAKNSEDKNIS